MGVQSGIRSTCSSSSWRFVIMFVAAPGLIRAIWPRQGGQAGS